MTDEIKQKIMQVVQQMDPEKVMNDQIWDVHFLDLGITSIEFIHLMVAIEKAFNIELPDDALDIDKHSTLQSVSELIYWIIGGDPFGASSL